MMSPGMHRDPKYPGKFGIPDYIVNTPQKTAQWWLVATLAALLVLPFGVWGSIYRGGDVAIGLYFALAALMGLNAWMLRNDINEDVPYLVTSIASAVVGLGAFAFLGGVKAFPESQWMAGAISVGIILILLNIIFRSWQSMLVIGVFTEQKRRIDTVASKRPAPPTPPSGPVTTSGGPTRRP